MVKYTLKILRCEHRSGVQAFHNIFLRKKITFEKVCEKECFDLIDLGTLKMEKNNQNEKM